MIQEWPLCHCYTDLCHPLLAVDKCCYLCKAKKAVAAHFSSEQMKSEQIRPFGFAEQHGSTVLCVTTRHCRLLLSCFAVPYSPFSAITVRWMILCLGMLIKKYNTEFITPSLPGLFGGY